MNKVPQFDMSLGDSPFEVMAGTILSSVVETHQPEHVHVVRIRDWFDHKWLGFSGKTLGALGWWSNKLTLPAFHPNRVISQQSFSLEQQAWRQNSKAKLHRKLPAARNLNAYIDRLPQPAVLFWYSQSSEHHAVMVYLSAEGKQYEWYASFDEKDGLPQLNKCKGISKRELESFLSPSASSLAF